MSKSNIPKYKEIYNQLINNIKSGRYKLGDRLPSEKELSENYNVSRITSKKALEMLTEKGYVKRMRGKGSFVNISTNSDENDACNDNKSTWKIGLVMDDINDIFGARILMTLEELAENNGFFIVLRLAYGKRDMEEKAIESLLEFGIDGMILMTTHCENFNPSLLKMVMNRVPLVLVDRYLKGIPAPYVGTDNVMSTIRATSYLLNLGHKDISFLTRPYTNTAVIEDRVAGFVRSHAEHGAAIDESNWIMDIKSQMPGCECSTNIEEDIQKIKDLIVRKRQITCFFAAEYRIGVLAKKAAEELGLSVPEDISIICFDGKNDSIDDCFFTHIVQRERDIGIKAMELLSEQILNHVDNSVQKIFYEADLIIGKSTAAPRFRD